MKVKKFIRMLLLLNYQLYSGVFFFFKKSLKLFVTIFSSSFIWCAKCFKTIPTAIRSIQSFDIRYLKSFSLFQEKLFTREDNSSKNENFLILEWSPSYFSYGTGSLFKTFVLKFLLYTLFHLNIRINYRLLTCGLTRI